MKILFVNNFRNRGGGEEFLRDLLPGLAAKGVQVGLICRPGTPLVEIFKNSAIELHPINRSGLHGISALFETAKVIRERGYQIINIQRGHDIIQSWIGSWLSGGKPMLMYTPQVPEFMRSRFLLSRMRKIVTISRHIRDRIVDFYPKIASRTSIIYYGIDLDTFKPELVRPGSLRARFGLSSDTPVIGTVGDLWKNQIEFLDALVLIRKELPETRFALVASENGNDSTVRFKQRVTELGLQDAILWAGRLSKEDMRAFYADIDLAISTHRNEGFGIWVLEALAMGAPVVAINEGGIRDPLDGCPGGVLIDGGPREMAAAVIGILKDDVRRASLAASGRSWVSERFSRERMIGDYYELFGSCLQNGPCKENTG